MQHVKWNGRYNKNTLIYVFSHAIALASAFNIETEMYIPENGFISLNIPLTGARFGSSSTRTTHPYYMKMLGSLIKNMGLEISILNPYQFKTKGEMVSECKIYHC